jgi:mRNA-degrading endonuclease RelE of RelBE toxin-antitoxin system
MTEIEIRYQQCKKDIQRLNAELDRLEKAWLNQVDDAVCEEQALHLEDGDIYEWIGRSGSYRILYNDKDKLKAFPLDRGPGYVYLEDEIQEYIRNGDWHFVANFNDLIENFER